MMKESELNDKLTQKLYEFENIETLQPTSEWNQLLLEKIALSKSTSKARSTRSIITVIVVCFITINFGIFINSIFSNSDKYSSRKVDLQVISNEFLNNPISTHN